MPRKRRHLRDSNISKVTAKKNNYHVRDERIGIERQFFAV
jgi:hypothetical protein